jgi:hypothetical protein
MVIHVDLFGTVERPGLFIAQERKGDDEETKVAGEM